MREGPSPSQSRWPWQRLADLLAISPWLRPGGVAPVNGAGGSFTLSGLSPKEITVTLRTAGVNEGGPLTTQAAPKTVSFTKVPTVKPSTSTTPTGSTGTAPGLSSAPTRSGWQANLDWAHGEWRRCHCRVPHVEGQDAPRTSPEPRHRCHQWARATSRTDAHDHARGTDSGRRCDHVRADQALTQAIAGEGHPLVADLRDKRLDGSGRDREDADAGR